MSKRYSLIILALCLAGSAIAVAAARSKPPAIGLTEADRLYAERSYAKALVGYQHVLATGAAGERQTEVEYRVAVCFGRSQQWDEAFAHTQAFVKAHPDGAWGARGNYWLGQLFTVAQHCGYRVGDRLYRGEDYPKLTSAEKPERACLCQEDADKAVAAFEKAKGLYERLRPRLEKEEADLNFDLARVLGNRDLMPMVQVLFALERAKRPSVVMRFGEPDPKEVTKLEGHDWNPTPDRLYDPTQPFPQRILGLYEQIERLEQGRRAAEARLARALYLRSYQEQMRARMRGYDEKKKEWVELPFPYQDVDALALLQSIADDFPKHENTPQAQFTVGQWLEGKGEFVKAISAYRRVIESWPKSKWVSDARDQIQGIKWPHLQLSTRVTEPGDNSSLKVRGRNVKTVSLTAYRVRLPEVLLARRVLNNARRSFRDFEQVFGRFPSPRWRSGKKVGSWTHVTKDTGEHKPISETVTIPLEKAGAYVVEAQAGEARAAAFLLITDLAVVLKSDSDRALAFVCSAKTGKPIPGANVVLREVYHQGNQPRVSVERGQANSEGLKGKPLTKGPGRHDNKVEAFVWVGDSYAIAGELCRQGYAEGLQREYRVYAYTDRPVYRPGQTVHFRSVVTSRATEREGPPAGSYRPASDLPFEVTVRDPRNEKVYEGTLTTNEFGSLNGSFRLGDEPALGLYRIAVVPPHEEARLHGARGNCFRVEEYKKPEFEVKVTPAAEQVRVGQDVKGTVEARYYFGSPVVGAQVKYRVFKTPYYPSFHFPRRYDWFTGRWIRRDHHVSYQEGEVVKEGEGRTDDKGQLTVEISTEGGGQWPDARAYTYTVEAEVTDPSRRTITGTGEVRASKQQFFAFLDVKRGFYQVGDRIEVEIATRDVMERPVAASGKMRVERVVRGASPSDLVETLVHTEGVTTDKDGRGFFRWTCQKAGQYRFMFEARDDWGQKVTASAYTWVNGPDFHKAAFRLSGIELIPEKRTYDEGETCRLLIVSNMPDVTVLLTQEVERQILAHAVLRLGRKSQVVEVKLHAGHVPNFTLKAVAIRDWQAYEAETEIFVPPGKQFLNVSVSSDRSEYRPGEKATFTLKATDWQDKPVRAELSVGVVDASLYYIQTDFAPDPRLFYYGDRRDVCIPRRWSFEWQPGGVSKTDRERQKYRRHEWALPEDMGQLQDWPSAGPSRHLGGSNIGFGGRAGGIAGPAGPPGWSIDYAERMPIAPPTERLARGVRAAGELSLMLAPPPMPKEGPGPELAAAEIRKQFADTAFWSPAIVTGEDGRATATVTMPENLTTWRTTVRGLTTDVQVGQATTECVTRKNVIVRLQAPRFFMERDLVALSANVHNYLKSEKSAKVTLTLGGGALELVRDVPADLGLEAPATDPEVWITVPKDGERRVDWVVRVLRAGTATVTMTAQTEEESDAVQMQFPALVHGVEKFEVQAGVMRDIEGERTITLKLNLPAERRQGATELNLQLTPSLAAIALDALPYLADYPYGCIEQTMSRFLPSALVARTLEDLGLDLEGLGKRAELYARELETSAGSERQPDSAYTYPKGMPGSFDARELASRMYLRRARGPIFDSAELNKMVRTGLARIYSKQRPDGGWGWWPNDLSDPYMTAYVCYGLYVAREAGWDIKDDVLEKGFQFLIKAIKEDNNLHRTAYVASVLTLRGPADDEVKSIISERLYRNRMKLTPYSQALLALALKQIGDAEKARVLVDNLENTAHIDRENGTCNWTGPRRGWWWHWWDSPVETSAAVLRAYLAVRPEGELAPMMVKWMVNNRRGNHWSSTKETAMAVYALADYMQVKKELAPDYTVTVDLEGRVQRTYRVNRENSLFFENRFIVGDEVLSDGQQTLTITVNGTGTLYYAAYLKYFSLEEDIKGGGNEIFVQRRYFKLTPRLVEKHEKNRRWQELTYEREELPSGAKLESGDMIEVELVIEAKNDYEYLVFEDMKPAGCEPVALRSGPGEGAGVYSYMELRDEKVAFFITRMPQGTRAARYRVRAEIPGSFHALPTNGYSMYAPDVRCLSDEWRLRIGD